MMMRLWKYLLHGMTDSTLSVCFEFLVLQLIVCTCIEMWHARMNGNMWPDIPSYQTYPGEILLGQIYH